eukprot:m.62447 g.62447  ORF g.62447 m.62447 type:complete len:63 (+) comp11912_c0_seq2:994-1182(+)
MRSRNNEKRGLEQWTNQTQALVQLTFHDIQRIQGGYFDVLYAEIMIYILKQAISRDDESAGN